MWCGGGSDTGAAGTLRAAWRARSLDSGWVFPEDWWTPEVDAVTYAVMEGGDAAGPCAGLGHARAQAGVGIGETLADLGALFAELGRDEPPMRCARALAEGWAESGVFGAAGLTCEDPLTGLTTPPYLRSRTAELYRGGDSPRDAYCLVVVDLAARLDPWKRIAWTIVVGHALRRAFPGEETLTLLGSGRVGALVPLRPELELVTARLRRDVATRHTARLWVEHLPEDALGAARLLDCLTTPPGRPGP